jgi:hypothetical protein
MAASRRQSVLVVAVQVTRIATTWFLLPNAFSPRLP